ncbi:MAG TPA: hypothetical protein VMG10_16000 [Gemmataceae bacterium]|nr:hypothetical protein [Gemmataceae bacterium]
MNPTYHGLPAAILVVSTVWLASAQEAARPKKKDESLEKIVRAAQGFSLSVAGKALKLEAAPVLRWPNPTRAIPDGATFVWTLDGRPLAIGCVWRFRGMGFAFHSLSQDPIQATRGDNVVWKCDKRGITLEIFADSPVPAKTAATRAKQIRDLARRFSCRLVGRGKEDLRLLTRPIYLWDRNGDKLTDLALFAFVQGTDPEVILLLETTKAAKGQQWRYALTRRTMAAIEADLDGKKVWSVEGGAGTRGEPWFQSGLPDPD